jgi:FAD/FMN-containing dehydrogenase
MKKQYLKDLQALLLGSVTDASDALEYFATDGSIVTLTPQGIVYPRNTADVRKTVQFLHERAEETPDKKITLTPRGLGTDQSGGALGDGLQLVFPAQMNSIIKLDGNNIVVQPGLLYRTLQQTLHTQGRFLPPYPSSIDYSTIGGAVANNAAGEKSVKYGSTKHFVHKLKVVLSDGSLIETGRISSKELNRKKGANSLEGQLYRDVDRIIDENHALLATARTKTSKNTAGYNLWDVKHKNGSFDLTPLFVGSQGTLGIITEITLKTAYYNPRTTLIVAFFDNLQKAADAVVKLEPLGASALEFVDYHLLDFVRRNRPQDIEGLVPENLPKFALFVEFDDTSQVRQTIKSRKAQRILHKYGAKQRVSVDPVEQQALWKIRRSAAAVMWMTNGAKKALPFMEDGVVPAAKLHQFLTETYKLLNKYDLEIAVWGHAGDANLHLQPFLDLGKAKDVDKLFDVADEYAKLVHSLGGSTCGEHNDGIVRAPYLKGVYGEEMYGLFEQVKAVCDPHGILNPHVKTGVTQEFVRAHLRKEYSMRHLYDHHPYC